MNNNRPVSLLMIMLSVFALILVTDPAFIVLLPFTPYGTILSLVNITTFSFIGFVFTTLAPDLYMDKEYKNKDNDSYGQVLIARSIHTLSFSVIFATALFVFVG